MIGGRLPLVPDILSQSDRVGAKFEQAAKTAKRYEIGCQLLLITNRKSHTGFRLVPTSMTLNDLERRNSLYFAFLWNSTYVQADYITVHNVRKILSPSSSLLLLAKTITHPAARSLCDSWTSCQLYSETLVWLYTCHQSRLGVMLIDQTWETTPSTLRWSHRT